MPTGKLVTTVLMSLAMMALAVYAVVHSVLVSPNVLNAVIFSIIFVAIPLFVWLAHRAVVALESLGVRLSEPRQAELVSRTAEPGALPLHDDGTLETDEDRRNPYHAPVSQ
jgi:uncharacterized membrane protein